MDAHDAIKRFKDGHEVAEGGDGSAGPHHGRNAAMVVAVMAAVLATATLLSNEAIKSVLRGETRRADTSAQLETNRLKTDVVSGNSVLLRVLSAGTPQEGHAAAAAEQYDNRTEQELNPRDKQLGAQIKVDEQTVSHADTQHLDYELAVVGLQVGIVLASVSIIARRRWLLIGGGAVATAGVVLLLVGALA